MIPDPWPDHDHDDDPRATLLAWVLFYVGVGIFAVTWVVVH